MPFTNREKAECAKREVAQRQRVYGRLMEQGRMNHMTARKEIALMTEIEHDYRLKAEAEEKKERLL